MTRKAPFAALIFFVIVAVGLGLDYMMYRSTTNPNAMVAGIITLIIAFVVSSAIQVADQWDKAVVLAFGSLSFT